MPIFRRTDVAAAAGGDETVQRLTPRHDVVHVVRVHLDQPLARAIELLDPDERARAARFVFDRDRRRFITSHGWTRLVLGSCLNQPPESLRFVLGHRGKPRLADPDGELQFSLSHAGERALIAIALGQSVGVDLEETRAIDALEIARRFFAPPEFAAIEALPEGERLAAFFRCWTRKEAFIKGLGDGFSFPTAGFHVSIDGDSAQLLRGCDAAPGELARWRVLALPAEPGYTAALAAGAGDWSACTWTTTSPA